MTVERVCAAYFSPCGNVRTVAETVGKAAADVLGLPFESIGFTLPGARTGDIAFGPEDLVVLAAPVYAGRVPNKLMPFIRDHIHGNGALCGAVVCFGNRAFDDALAELFMLARDNGFTVLGATAVATEHSFAPSLGTGRPDEKDLAALRGFGEALRADGAPAKFLKAVPKTDMAKCTHCGTCAKVCPMGSVDPADPSVTTGVCIKCQACIKLCPAGTRYFDDGDFLSHREMLMANYARWAESAFFL